MAIIDGRKATPFWNSDSNIYGIQMEIKKVLREINSNNRYRIFGLREPAINSNEVFTGSFRYHLDRTLRHEYLPSMKIGDVDVIVPDRFRREFEHYFQKKSIPYKSHGTQISTLFSMSSYKTDVSEIQVDFEFKGFCEDMPTEFSKFSNSWSPDDVADGLKGVFHKVMLSALTAANNEKWAFSVSYGLRERNYSFWIEDLEKIYMELFLINPDTNRTVSEQLDIIYNSSEIHYNLNSFRGLLVGMLKYYEPHQIKSVLDKFVRKVKEKPYSDEQLAIVSRLLKNYLLFTILPEEMKYEKRRNSNRKIQPANV